MRFDWARGSPIGCYSDMCGSSCVIGAHAAITNVGLLPSEWVNLGESFPERLAGEEVGGVFDRGKNGQAFLRRHPDHPSPL